MKKDKATYTVENCTIQNGVEANEHTRASVEALAQAAAENAKAISEIAKALTGGGCTMQSGIQIGNGQ